jgi:hypothetical protein
LAITTIDGLVAALVYPSWPILKAGFSPQVAGCWTSLWVQAGIPGAGANSADGVNGAIPTDATAGAYPFTNVSSTYLARLAYYGTVLGQLLLYDRLWHNSGLSVTTVGNQALTSTTLTRPDANGADVEAWLQVYTTLGAGSTAKTIAYTDQDGNTAQVGTLQGFVTTAAAQRTFPFSLAAGDTGVRVITGFDNVATSTSGTFGLILRRLISGLAIPASNTGAVLDPIQGGLPRIYDDACLELIWLASSTTSMTVGGSIQIAQG